MQLLHFEGCGLIWELSSREVNVLDVWGMDG